MTKLLRKKIELNRFKLLEVFTIFIFYIILLKLTFSILFVLFSFKYHTLKSKISRRKVAKIIKISQCKKRIEVK